MSTNGEPARGAILLEKLLHGATPESLANHVEGLEEPWRELFDLLALSDPEHRQIALQQRLRTLPNAGAVIEQMPKAMLAAQNRHESYGNAPELPPEVLLDAPEAPTELLSDYVRYASAASPMTPHSFHESAALFLVSMVIARRVVVNMPWGPLFPNIFVTWVAPTTLFHKTTALGCAERVARRACPHLLASEDVTPEALISEMAGEKPRNFEHLSPDVREIWERGSRHAAQRGWVTDELSGLLVRTKKDYNAGLLETLIKLYDCDEERRRVTQTQGLLIVRGAYLSMLTASTPDALGPYLSRDQLWNMGWWPRFALLSPDRKAPSYQVAREAPQPDAFVARLRAIDEMLPATSSGTLPAVLVAQRLDGVDEALERYTRAVTHDLIVGGGLDRRLHGCYGRLPAQVLKVATLLATLDWCDAVVPAISLRHFAHAQQIVEEWRLSKHRILADTGLSEFGRIRGRIRAIVEGAEPRGVTRRDVYRQLPGVEPDTLINVLRQMVAIGELEEQESPPGPKGGPRTFRFRIARNAGG